MDEIRPLRSNEHSNTTNEDAHCEDLCEPHIDHRDPDSSRGDNTRSLTPISISPTLYELGGVGPTGENSTSSISTPVQETPPGQQLASKSNWVHRFWLWEVLSILVATVSLAAITITLRMHEGRPLPRWPSAITINALISVFTAVLKACLVMPISESISHLKWQWFQKPRPLNHIDQWDLASRGPWGSFLLTFILQGRSLAVLGATLTVVAMAIDPFTQQVVQHQSCSTIAENEIATIPFSNNYTNGYSSWRSSGSGMADPQMQAAMYIGLLNPPTNISAAITTHSCKTGNCTFAATDDGATFLSLAFQSECIDISDRILYTFNTSRDPGDYYYYGNASLPGSTAYIDFLTNETGYSVHSEVVMRSTYLDSYPANHYPSSFLSRVSFLMFLESDVINPRPMRAFECEFFPAVTTFGANITNGRLLEHVLNSQRMDVYNIVGDTNSMLLINKTVKNGVWHDCQGLPDPSDDNNTPVVSPSQPGPPPYIGSPLPPDVLMNKSDDGLGVWNITTWWPQECAYWLPDQSSAGLSRALYKLLGNKSVGTITDLSGSFTGNLWSVNLWNNGNASLETVQKAMDGLCSAISAQWRTGDGFSNNIGPAVGTVRQNETCIRVNWAWLALPAAFLFLTVVFFILTIVQTRSTHVWKSSMLAMLFNGLDVKTRESFRSVVSMQDMKVAADTAIVLLENTADGFRFVGRRRTVRRSSSTSVTSN